MFNRLLATTALAVVLSVPAALAQNTAPTATPPAQGMQTPTTGQLDFVTSQAPEDWSAEALIGRTVQNDNGDNLGDINNVILTESGEVKAIIIGVGGFLGIGEKNVGVPFSALQFRVDPATTDRVPADRTMNQGQAAQPPAAGYATDANARWDAEHADVMIILSATKEQLEAAPDFAWLGEDANPATPQQPAR